MGHIDEHFHCILYAQNEKKNCHFFHDRHIISQTHNLNVSPNHNGFIVKHQNGQSVAKTLRKIMLNLHIH